MRMSRVKLNQTSPVTVEIATVDSDKRNLTNTVDYRRADGVLAVLKNLEDIEYVVVSKSKPSIYNRKPQARVTIIPKYQHPQFSDALVDAAITLEVNRIELEKKVADMIANVVIWASVVIIFMAFIFSLVYWCNMP